MKKQEIRWISRDEDGTYCTWRKKPKIVDGCYDSVEDYSIIQRGADAWERFHVVIKRGGLAKVIIRRRY